MQKILIVEDQEDIAKGIEINLAKEGFRVVRTNRGDNGLSLAIKESPDLIILDVMLPGLNGFDVCRELRQKGVDIPIIFLTAKAEEVDRVVGLEIGADDYVTKPFSIRELVARVHSRFRRTPPRAAESMAKYRFGNVEVDFDKFEVTRKGKPVDMTAKEFEVLRFLIRHRGTVVLRDRLLEEVWGYESYPTTRTVDNHILKLRQKLEADSANPKYILTIYGEGYKFVG